ncbi:SusC/RagA family TonB-linked outer membrane protein [Sphingobacterium hungaricum]|uniref:SusC/RagA family protein n=1 Tax=Sphingobacterium hungaricum TaxID=2082723 RepID=A0A928UWD8_9SPHI|nr:TonB-dependent receptor [Sphingobacterium hungaricum]MBE8714460.1 SusC/RagA family protein [Sphingobacterium hungaricum]
MITKLINYLLVGMLLSTYIAASAQSPILTTGKVITIDGKGLPGATVKFVNAQNNELVTEISADEDGVFQINSLSDKIVYNIYAQHVGFHQEAILNFVVSANKTNSILIRLKDDQSEIDEVVVVGYGTQKKVNLTGAVSTVSGKDIATRPVGQTTAALQGMAPGVTITQRSGKPGSDGGDIRIRGIGTLGSAGPMVLIDGIEGSINNIDPNLIESVSILKDAASSSIYGSRAANGVILVTTKRGAGDKISISYNNYFGWQNPTNMPEIVNALDHMLLTNEAYTNVGSSPLYPEDILEAYRLQGSGSSDQYPNTDWQKESLLGNGFQQSHFVTINGGTNNVKMLASLGYYDQNGLTLNSGFRRYTIRNNIDIKFSEKFLAKIDLQYVNPIVTSPSAGIENIFQWMNSIPANQSFRNSDGTWGLGWNGNNSVSAAMDGGVSLNKAPFGSINASVIYKPLDWLTAEVNYAPKYATQVNKNFREVVQSHHPDGTPSFAVPVRASLTQYSSQDMYNNMRATVNMAKDFGDHNLSLLLGASREDFTTDYIQGFRDIFVLPEFPVLDAGSALNQSATGSASEWALQSFFSRFNYNYKQKYLLELNARYDGSSRFLKGNRYGFFPSMSAGWRFTEESFMSEAKSWLNEGKVRFSWGQLGNQNIGTYPAVAALNLGSYTLGNEIINTAALNDLSNPNITWESSEEKNFGIDLTLFRNFTLTADYYSRKTSDILLQLNIPLILGLNPPYQNAGVVENKGWEVSLGYRNDFDKEFRYSFTFNLSDVRNKVLDMKGINQTGLTVNREGFPINSIFGYETEGYFQSADEIASHATQFGTLAPGDLKYKDQNGDGKINESDKVIIGNPIPRYTYSLNSNFSYKGIDLSFLLQGVGKANGYLYGAGIQPFTTTGAIGGTIREDNKDRWTPENPNAAYPRLAFGQNNNQQASQFWMRDASYLRLKNLQIGYKIPLKNNTIKNLRVFANGSNLFSIDNFWEGYDVEAPIGVGNYYPQVQVYTFGVDVTF